MKAKETFKAKSTNWFSQRVCFHCHRYRLL